MAQQTRKTDGASETREDLRGLRADLFDHSTEPIKVLFPTLQDEGFLHPKKAKTITYIGLADVYNLEVDDVHAFSVEGGIIVHNCYDAGGFVLAHLTMGIKHQSKGYAGVGTSR